MNVLINELKKLGELSVKEEELLTNKSLHTTYGIFVWLVAGLTSAAAVWIYKSYF